MAIYWGDASENPYNSYRQPKTGGNHMINKRENL